MNHDCSFAVSTWLQIQTKLFRALQPHSFGIRMSLFLLLYLFMNISHELAGKIASSVFILRDHRGSSQEELCPGRRAVNRVESGDPSIYSEEVLQSVLHSLGCADVPDLLAKAETIRRWSQVTRKSDKLRSELFGKAVRAIREHRGLYLRELQVPKSQASMIERGLPIDQLSESRQKIMKTLGFDDAGELIRAGEEILRNRVDNATSSAQIGLLDPSAGENRVGRER